MDNDIAIVLTATIIPNSILTEHSDFILRRAEYLKAIEYYKKYANVFFLENSSYYHKTMWITGFKYLPSL